MTEAQKEMTAAEAVLKAYVQHVFGWEAMFVPENAYVVGVTDVMNAVRGIKNPHERQLKGFAALRAALNSTGEGNRVSDAQVNTAVADILKVVKL